MKRLFLLASLLILLVVNSFSQVLFSEYFESAYSSRFFMAYGTSNAGNDYTCSFNNKVGLMNSSSDEYLTTKAVNVAPGYGVKISFNLRKATSYSTSNIKVYFVVNKETTFNWNNPTYNAWTEVKSFSAQASNTSCTLNTINLPAEVVGGQRLSITIQFKSASSSSWVAIDDLVIEQSNYTTPTNSYSENFNSGKWYPNGSIAVPYHSYVTASNGYTYLSNYGKDGYSDYYAAFYTGGDYVEGGQTNFITKEINTSNYQNGELRYMWRSQYPCGGPNSYTFDETYNSYAPKVYILAGSFSGSSWQQLPVNNYFPDATWRYSSIDISQFKNQSVKIKFERGGYCTNPVEAVDNVKVFDRNCMLSKEKCGEISGPVAPVAGVDLQYSVQPVNNAVYYKWFVRDGGNLYSSTPYIVSGQGTTNVTINFGSLTGDKRVICIPYDVDLTKTSSPEDACYAQLAFSKITISGCDEPLVTLQPSDTTLCEGATVNLKVEATGTSELLFQWKKDGANLSDNANIEGATSATLLIKNITAADTGSYSCYITNPCGNTTSDAAKIATNNSLSFIKQPNSKFVCAGAADHFRVIVSGNEPITYKWKKNGIELVDGGNISGSAGDMLHIANISVADTGTYICYATNICGEKASSPAKLQVNNNLTLTEEPKNQIVCNGGKALFAVKVLNSDGVSFKWRKDNVEINDDDNITGTQTANLSINKTALSDTGLYNCYIKNACGDTVSQTALLVVNDTNLTIIKNPETFLKCQGEKGELSLEATGAKLFTYQWYKDDKIIKNATNKVYSIDSLSKNDENFYFCLVNNGCIKKSTDTVFILVNTPPVINVAPVTLEKIEGETVIFSLSPSGTPPFDYQWILNNIDIPGATENKYTINPVTKADAGIYYCKILNECGNTKIEVATLNVKDNIPDSYLVFGTVKYDNTANSPIKNVLVYLCKDEINNIIDSTLTDSIGYYRFVTTNGNYFVKARTDIAAGGIDPIDALMVNRYYLSVYKFPNELRKKAADVNADKKIDPIDALMIVRKYLGVYPKFIAGKWIFQELSFTVSGSDIEINIKGICVGDVNANYIPK